MDPNGTGDGGSSSADVSAATLAAWNYAANAQNYANPAVTTAATTAHQGYGNAETAQSYASAINWWQQQAQAHAQQLAQQQAQSASQTSTPQESESPPLQQPVSQQPQSTSPTATATSQSATTQQQQLNMYQYNQQLLQYQYQQLQNANYQHHTGAPGGAASGAASNFPTPTGGAMTPSVYNNKMTPDRRPSGGSPPLAGIKRKRKDPNRPKRPTSAYFFFLQSQRKICEERGEKITKVAQWVKEISAVWRALTPEEKVEFDQKAAADKERYNSERGRFKNKDPNRPKRPLSAYFLWLGDFREKMKDKIPVNKELLRAAGANWRQLTETDKIPYDKLAEVERQKYEAAMREYSQRPQENDKSDSPPHLTPQQPQHPRSPGDSPPLLPPQGQPKPAADIIRTPSHLHSQGQPPPPMRDMYGQQHYQPAAGDMSQRPITHPFSHPGMPGMHPLALDRKNGEVSDDDDDDDDYEDDDE